MSKILENYFQQSLGVENSFRKKILFIGCESYDASSITILEGLKKLGFTIEVLKSNINSWFCESIVDNISGEYDFCLTNVQWGIRWDLINSLPREIPRVMIDSSDAPNGNTTWKRKLAVCGDGPPPPEDLSQELFDYRWTLDYGNYKPDVIFTSQKQYEQREYQDIYFPFGILDSYLGYGHKNFEGRNTDFAHISGPGSKRAEADNLMASKTIRGNNFYGKVYGKRQFPEKIERVGNIDYEKNVHSYHRWSNNEEYFQKLLDTKCIIYNGVDNWPFWDSKRPWESLACGCYLLFTKPSIDISEYPLWECDDFSLCNNLYELRDKANYLFENQDEFKQRTEKMTSNAVKYFNSETLARYFLLRMKKFI